MNKCAIHEQVPVTDKRLRVKLPRIAQAHQSYAIPMGFDCSRLDTNIYIYIFHISKQFPHAVGIKKLHKNPYGLHIQLVLLSLKFRLAEKITSYKITYLGLNFQLHDMSFSIF